MSLGFAAGEGEWRARLGALRQVVRQEMVSRQLAAHLPDAPPQRVLDIGCGQGTQALRLARRGHNIVGLDTSASLLEDFERALSVEPQDVQERVQLIQGDAEKVDRLFAPSSFDVILCHGVLMYFDDPNPLLTAIAAIVTGGGLVSLLVRNGDALAMRPGLLGDWTTARDAFDRASYLNRIGVQARADQLDDLTTSLAERNLSVQAWYGVRVFTDAAATDAPVPDANQFDLLLDCEERAGHTDPYRQVAALLHVIAQRV